MTAPFNVYCLLWLLAPRLIILRLSASGFSVACPKGLYIRSHEKEKNPQGWSVNLKSLARINVHSGCSVLSSVVSLPRPAACVHPCLPVVGHLLVGVK